MTRDSDAYTLTRAKALLHSRAEVLADFERDLILEAHQRVRAGGVATAAEMDVIRSAVEAMRAAGRQDLTAEGLAA